MSYELQKPYSDEQKADFIVEYNHNQGLRIEETETTIYALEPWEKFIDGEVIDNTEEYEKEQAKEERKRLDNLSLTAADVERAIYKAKGMDFDDILELVKNNPEIDLKALKIELKANNFYRGSEYVSKIGNILGFTEAQLDEFFETNDYTKLLPIEDENEELPEVVAENATTDDKLPM